MPMGFGIENRVIPPLINDHLPKHIRNFAAIGGYSLLWPEATAFLRHKGAYSRPEVAIVACGPRPQGFISHNSKPTPVRMDNTRVFNVLPSRQLEVIYLSNLLQDPMGHFQFSQ